MPTDSSWVEPEEFLEYRGTTVYYVYRNDDISQGRRQYWYTLDTVCEECDCSLNECCSSAGRCVMVFDVRQLPTYGDGSEQKFFKTEEYFLAAVIKKNIELGVLGPFGLNDPRNLEELQAP